jgi:outer membrane protein assembly factor BamB
MNTAKPMTSVLAGCVLLFSVTCANAQDWPQWRGPERDNKVTGFMPPKAWPKDLTKKWRIPLEVADASPVLVGDKIYVFTRKGSDEVLMCLNADNGEVVWQDKYKAPTVTRPASGFPGGPQHSGPRSTPAVAEGKVCTLGVAGVVSCLDVASGKVVWRKDTKSKPKFFTSSSPLIVGGKCIVYVSALIAYDLSTGDEKWKWTEGSTPYGSPVLMTVAGTKQVVTPTQSSVVGVGLDDGKLLWKAPFSAKYMNDTPIIAGDTVIFSAQGTGTAAWKIEKQGDKFAATPFWKKGQASSNYNTPVMRDGLLYGLSSGQTLYCMDAKTGEVLWNDAKRRGECGAVLNAGSVLLALTSDNNLVAFEPSAKEYKELARYRVSNTYTWAYPIIAGNRIFVRDSNSLTLWTME